MQNKFGLKDFVLLVLVVGVGVSIWLGMIQEDRRWDELRAQNARLTDMERNIARIQQAIDRGLVAARGAGSAAGADRDESWAVEGVPIVWAQPWDFTDDPYDDSGFTPGGEFTEIFEGQPPNITPYLYQDVYGRRVVELVTESLGVYDAESLRIRGRLADAWQMDPDGLWLRVRINSRARFSDGEPVTAEDARFTFHDVILNPQIEAERFRSTFNSITKVEPVGERVVDIHFSEPRFDNLDKAMLFPVLPKHVYEEVVQTPAIFNQSTGMLIGSGPFRLERFDIDDQWAPPRDVVLVRNELYWGPKPALERIRLKTIEDSLARLTAYTNGEGDMMRPTSQQFALKKDDPEFLERHDTHAWYNMRGGYTFIGWQCGPRNGRLTPFHDRRVRLAMAHIIDRERIVRDIYQGLAKIATGPFASSTEQAAPDVEPWPFDPARGVALLAEAGWTDRDNDGVLENERGDEFTFEFVYGQGNESTLQLVTYVKDACAAVGIRCNLRPIDWSILVQVLKTRDFDAITFGWAPSAPESDPEQIYHSKSIADQGDNFIQWASEEADELIEQGRRTVDFDERMRYWHELHRVIHEEQPYLYLVESPWLRFTTERVRNFGEYPSGVEYNQIWLSREASPSN